MSIRSDIYKYIINAVETRKLISKSSAEKGQYVDAERFRNEAAVLEQIWPKLGEIIAEHENES